MSALDGLFSAVIDRPGRTAFVVYLILGVGFALYMMSQKRFTAKPAWDRRQRAANMLDIFFFAGSMFPLVFLLQIVLWPLWAVLFWAYRLGHDDKTI